MILHSSGRLALRCSEARGRGFQQHVERAGHGRDACVSLQVDDADAYFEEWHAKVDIPRQPRDEDWGARTFSVHDPFGNTIFVIGPVR